VARSVTVICATTTPNPGTHGLGVVPTVMSRLLEPAWLAPKHKGSSAGWPNVKLTCRLDTAGGGSYRPPCYIARLRQIQTEKAAASPRSNGSSPRPPRGEFTTSAPPREIAAREIGRSLWHRFRLFVDLCRWPISARAARNTEPTGKRPQNAPGIPGLWGSPAFKHDEKPTG